MRVFSLEGGDDLGMDNWKQINQDIIGEAIGNSFWYSVSISKDGKTIAVGDEENDGDYGMDLGRVRVYCLVDDDIWWTIGMSWEQIGQDIIGEAADDGLGWPVAQLGNGSTVAIGAPWNDKIDLRLVQVTVH